MAATIAISVLVIIFYFAIKNRTLVRPNFSNDHNLYYNTKERILYDISVVDKMLIIQPIKKRGNFKMCSNGETVRCRKFF